MSEVVIISDVPRTTGWAPVLHMEQMLARAVGGSVHDVSGAWSHRIQSILYSILPRQRQSGDRVAIFVACTAYGARKFIPAAKEIGRFARTAIWIVDSFWTDAVERERRLIDRHFDVVAYMQASDDDFYRTRFGNRALRLEWGSDALDLGGFGKERTLDLLRVGRQPPSWDDDKQTAEDCAARSLRFAGRPAMDEPGETVLRTLMTHHYSTTKMVLAHSNIAAPASYTHPTTAYITGRWTDALACGASVVGVPPEGDLATINWPEALVRLPDLDRATGLDLIAAAAAAWTPEIARINHLGALRRLDWRWRFGKLAKALDIQAPRLDQEIARLEARIAEIAAMAPKQGVADGVGH